MTTPLKSSLGALFVQLDGPNSEPVYVGCVDVDSLTASGGAIDTLRRCFKQDGSGWNILAATRSPDEPVTTTITAQIDGRQGTLSRVQDFASLIVQVREEGVANDRANWVEAYALAQFYVGETSISNAVMREDEQFGEKSFGISALPPLYETFKRTTARQSSAEAEAINDVAVYGTGRNFGKLGYIVANAGSGVTANVYYTRDRGDTWTVAAADPFAVDEHIASVVAFKFGAEGERVIVARGVTDASNPAEIAYSDDRGATWTTVNTGSTNAQFVQGPNGMFALDPYNIYVVTDGGYIYKSIDLGATWTVADAGVATTNDLNAIHFADSEVGYAAADSGVVLKTEDAGASWTAVTAVTGTPDLTDVYTIDADNAWVSTASATLFYTTDGGTTWTQRTFDNSGTGNIKALKFADEMNGAMVWNPSSGSGKIYTTKDGGYTWEAASTKANSGLLSIELIDENEAIYTGGVHTSLGYIGKIFPRR